MRFAVASDGSVTADPVEVLAADIAADGEEVALAKVVAPLIGLGTDEVFRRAQRAQRRRQRLWIAGLSTVAIVLAGLAVWAEINRSEAVTQREQAERNFAVAKQGADALVFDIAQGLRNVEGMRAETVRKILGRAEEAFAKLVERSGDNQDLLTSQAAMLLEFADTYAAQGDTSKQMDSAKGALAIFDRLSQADPAQARYQLGQAVAHSRIGDSLTAQGSLPDALKAYRQSLALVEGLLKSDPDNAKAQDLSTNFHDKIANTLLEQGDLAGALKGYRESLALRGKQARANPEDANLKRALSISYIKVGEVHRAQGQLPEALKAYSESANIFDGLARADTTSAQWQRDLSVAKERIGDTLSAQGNPSAALAAYRESLAIAERLAKLDPSNAERPGRSRLVARQGRKRRNRPGKSRQSADGLPGKPRHQGAHRQGGPSQRRLAAGLGRLPRQCRRRSQGRGGSIGCAAILSGDPRHF